jgi:D-ribose pyranase
MKKTPLLNTALSEVISSLGHTDLLVIGDAGLPIPLHTRRIDLALTQGIPGFIQTLEVILSEMQVEEAFVAGETRQVSPHILESIETLLPRETIQFVTHEELKALAREAVAVVRTGEFTPYANIVLKSGVVF